MTFEQQAAIGAEAREAARRFEEVEIELLVEHNITTPAMTDIYVAGFLAAAEPREKELSNLHDRYKAANLIIHDLYAAKKKNDAEIAELRAAFARARERILYETYGSDVVNEVLGVLDDEFSGAIPPARELLQEEGTLSAEVESLGSDWCNEITRSAPVAYCGLRAGHDGAHRSEGLPELCYTPSECAGRTSCPRPRACSS